MFYVDFHSAKNPGERVSERYDTLGEAAAVCRVLRDHAGAFPLIRCNNFRAIPSFDKTAARPLLKWSLSFPRSIYKGSATVRAEQAGVRYVSHRQGYVASDRAFDRFCVLWDEFAAWCALPEVAAMRAANAAVSA